MGGLFGLGEQEQNPGAFWSLDLPVRFLGAEGSCQAVASLIITRFSIYEDYIAMRVVTRNISLDELPGSGWRIITQGDLVPPAERADDFDRCWWGRLLGWYRPTEHFSKAEPLFGLFSLGSGPSFRCDAGF